MEQNKNGSYVTYTISQTEDVETSGIQNVFGTQKSKGGYPFITGDGNISVKLTKDTAFRTIPVTSINNYLPIEILEIDWDNSDAVINHFGR